MTEFVFINISLQDRDGNVFTDNNETVSLSIDGDGELLGIGSGNPKSQCAYTGNTTETWNGRAFAIIRKRSRSLSITAETKSGLKVMQII